MNLRNAYPEADKEWLKKTEKNFYHFFADLLVEIPYFRNMTEQELFKRIDVVNWKEVDRMAEQYGGVMLMTSHYGNWEWLTFLGNHSVLTGKRFFNVYKRLSNGYFDKLKRTHQIILLCLNCACHRLQPLHRVCWQARAPLLVLLT